MADAVPEKPVDAPQGDGGGKPPRPANDSVRPLPAIAALPAAPAPEMPPAEASLLPETKTASAETAARNIFPAFNARAILTESGEKSSLPRAAAEEAAAVKEPEKAPEKKEAGFPKYLRLAGMGDIVDAAKQPKRKGHHITQAIFDKMGFGDIYRAAAAPRQKPIQKVVGIAKAVGKKAADMIAGRFVSGSFRLIAITFVAGMIGGVTGWGSIFLLGLATGAASAIYTYGKEYLGDKLSGPKEERKKVKFFERKRAESAAKAFASGTFNGAFGAWLAGLPIFQSLMKLLHDTIHQGIGQISKPFNEAAAPRFSAPQQILSKFSAAAGRAPPVPAGLAPPTTWQARKGFQPAFGM